MGAHRHGKRGHLPTPGKVAKCVVLEFEGEREDAVRVPQVWDWEANANCPQILPYTRIQIRGKIVADSGHLDTKNCI